MKSTVSVQCQQLDYSLLKMATESVQQATPSTSTPEYLAFQQCYEFLVLHIELHPNDFCDSLFAKGYIPEAVREYIRNESNVNKKKAEKLVDSVADQIKHDPSVFHGFIEILVESHSLCKLAGRLQQYCDDYNCGGERLRKIRILDNLKLLTTHPVICVDDEYARCYTRYTGKRLTFHAAGLHDRSGKTQNPLSDAMAAGSSTHFTSTSHSDSRHQRSESGDTHPPSYPQFVPGSSEGELFGEVHTQYVQSVSHGNTEHVGPTDGQTVNTESRSTAARRIYPRRDRRRIKRFESKW